MIMTGSVARTDASKRKKPAEAGRFAKHDHPDILSVASWQWSILPDRCTVPSLQLLNWILPMLEVSAKSQ